MNIFGWLSTGRAFARPAFSRAQNTGIQNAAQNYVALRSGTKAAGRAPLDQRPAIGSTHPSYLSALPLGLMGGGLVGGSLMGGHLAGSGSPIGPADYAAQVQSSFASNAVAQRAARLVAEAIADAPIDCDNPAIAPLIAAPSAAQNLLEAVTLHLLLHGNAYVQAIRGGDGQVAELYALRPDRIRIIPDARGWPMAFDYRIGAGSDAMRLAVDGPDGLPLVAHIRQMHPTDDHYGLGALSAASAAVQLHNAAAQWNIALLNNAARPSGALVHDGGDLGALSDAQFTRLKAELEAGYMGAAQAGRPMLLEGGLKWQAMSLSPADMDFAGLRDAAAREIAMAFGVPPMLIGLPGDATYANYREASKALWRNSILPLAGRILSGISALLQPHLPHAHLRIDLNQVTALAEDRERLWDHVSAADFLSADEKRNLLGIAEPVPEAGPEPRQTPTITTEKHDANR
jgi:HK97 family phage portal protein